MGDETKAAPSSRPENDEKGAILIAQSGRQSAEDAAKERASVAPQLLSGPGTGSRLVRDDGTAISGVSDVSGDEGETIVTIDGDVYEEFAAPGAPNRKIKRLLFHHGQKVPKSVLARHEEQLKHNSREADRLAKLGTGTGHPDDPDNETKEGAGGDGGEVKEGARGRTTRRS